MKVFGFWERLTKLVFFKTQQVTIEPVTQTGGTDKTISVPDMASNTTQDMVLTAQTQTLTNKTLSSGTLSGSIAGTPTFTGTTVTFSGDIAVNGGDITTTGTTATVFNTNATTLSIGGAATNLTIGNSAASNTALSIGTGVLTTGTKTVNIGTGATGGATTINLGASGATSTTTVNRALVVSTPSGSTATSLQITNLGTGDTLLIEDNTSPDATATRIDAAGNVGIGVSTATSLTDALTVVGTTSLSDNIKIASTKGIISSAAGSTINIGTTAETTTLNVGSTTGDAQTVNIATGATSSGVTKTVFIASGGNAGSTTNITLGGASSGGTTTINSPTTNVQGSLTVAGNLTVSGSTTTVNTTQLLVKDTTITLNDGGLAASGAGVGIEVEENAAITGYVKVAADRNGWEFLAPNSANVVTIPNSLAAGSVVLTAGNQSIAGDKTFSGITTTISGTAALSGANVNLASTSTVGPTVTSGTTTNLVHAATVSAATKTIKIGESGLSGSTTAVSIGSAVSGALNTVTFNGTNAVKLPSGTTAQQPGQAGQPAAVNGMIRYNSSNGAFEGYASGAWSAIGGGGTIDKITQANAGFSVGDVLYLNGSTYTEAIATSATTAEVVGVVSRIVDSTPATFTFEMTLSGEISGLLAANFDENALPAAGEVVFLSPTNAGKMTITEPSVVGQVSIPLGVVSGSGTLYVAPKRGVVVGGANVRTQIGLSNAATTTVQNASGYDAGSIEGWVYIDGTTNYRFHVRAQFAKNGAASDYNLSYQTTGDTPPAGFSMSITSAGLIQVTLPTIAGFASAYINFALNAPAVGATLPLQISGGLVTAPVLGAGTGATIAAGYVGEEIKQSLATTTTTTTTGDLEIDVTNASITLSTGVWELQYFADIGISRTPAGTAAVFGRIRVTDSLNANESGMESFFGHWNQASSVVETYSTATKIKRIEITSGTKTYKLRITCNQSNTAGTCSAINGSATGSITGNDASTYIRAVRIA